MCICHLQVLVPVDLSAGLLYLEVQRGSFMGPALPVLVAPTAALAAEAACMLQATLPAHQQGLTVDLGCAMLRLSACHKLPRYASQILVGQYIHEVICGASLVHAWTSHPVLAAEHYVTLRHAGWRSGLG